MEVEGKETYVNCITIEDFMIQINDTNMALMLILQGFSQMSPS